MASENSLVAIDVYYFTFRGFKYNLASFVKKLTNAQKIVLESFNKQYNFNGSGGIFTNTTYFTTYSDDFSIAIVSKCDKSSILQCERCELCFISRHVS